MASRSCARADDRDAQTVAQSGRTTMNRHSINLSAVGVSAFASFLIGFL